MGILRFNSVDRGGKYSLFLKSLGVSTLPTVVATSTNPCDLYARDLGVMVADELPTPEPNDAAIIRFFFFFLLMDWVQSGCDCGDKVVNLGLLSCRAGFSATASG